MNNTSSVITSHITLLLGILIYISYPKEFRINQSLLYYLSIIHNGILIIFSGWTFISLVQILYNNGIVFESNYYFQNPNMDNIIYFFYISKYYEFFDTFLLYLNGKNPIFLQKYHHIGAVVCWHLCYYYKVDAVWIATILNSFVHIIMYSYYLGSLLKINYLKFIKKYITTLQLCQLIFQPLCLFLYRDEKYYNTLLLFTLYTIGLVILFGIFYYNNYIINNKLN